MTELEQAAIDYVVARKANEGAEPADWMASLAEVDRTWHLLVVAFEKHEYPATVPEASTARGEAPVVAQETK